MKFTQRGLLNPSARIELTHLEFKRVFVDEPGTESRAAIYSNHLAYTQAFTKRVTTRFTQWIGGSFTTDKAHPRDIDLLTILDRREYNNQYADIEGAFGKVSTTYPRVDGYFLLRVPTSDPARSLYEADRTYWEQQFGYTRRNRRGIRHPRGYIEIRFNDYDHDH